MEQQLKHFSHQHLLSLVQLQPDHSDEISRKEDEDVDELEDDLVVEEIPRSVGECNMCKEEIYSFHLCYYSCKDCDYFLHTFCAQLPMVQQNHPIHPGHILTLSHGYQGPLDPGSEWICDICGAKRTNFYNYHCSICYFDMDIVCASIAEQKIDHPSHPHQLQRHFHQMISRCSACGDKHSGTFYHCTTCSFFMIHSNCASLPAKLLIQHSTKGNISHPHFLTLTYSLTFIEMKAKFFPCCRVCEKYFNSPTRWHYRCEKCRYFAHADCANLTTEAFMSTILMPAGLLETFKNFKDDDHPNLIHYPFPDESVNLLMHLFSNKGKLVLQGKINGEMLSHPHPLILVDTFLNGPVSLHDPMKKVELLCDGCVRPITDLPFYKCTHYQCSFALHEWCTRLPSTIHHHDHPKHKLVLMPKVPKYLLGVFQCKICELYCNGFAYGCKQCGYYVDINCGFIPDEITHESHPNHLLLRIKVSADHSKKRCKACRYFMVERLGFHCPSCDIYLHICCALMLPESIRHKYDKHPLNLRYHPAENHIGEYFCDICEDEFDPNRWFYHCSTCASSMHTACAPVKLQCEKSPPPGFNNPLFQFFNVKFGGKYTIRDHPHPITFVQGISYDGQCNICHEQLQYAMIFKCFECNFACHIWCTRVLSNLVA